MQKARLLKLADFLENDPRVRGHFDLNTWVTGGAARLMAGDCGTAACVCGWVPVVWPKYWVYDRTGNYPQLVGSLWVTTTMQFAEFMGISYGAAAVVLLPQHYGGGPIKSAKRPVARIRGLVARGYITVRGLGRIYA